MDPNALKFFGVFFAAVAILGAAIGWTEVVKAPTGEPQALVKKRKVIGFVAVGMVLFGAIGCTIALRVLTHA